MRFDCTQIGELQVGTGDMSYTSDKTFSRIRVTEKKKKKKKKFICQLLF